MLGSFAGVVGSTPETQPESSLKPTSKKGRSQYYTRSQHITTLQHDFDKFTTSFSFPFTYPSTSLLVKLAFTTNPVKVLRRLTPSYFYPSTTSASTPPPSQSHRPFHLNTAKVSSTVLQRPGALTFAEPAAKPDGDNMTMRQSSPPLCVQNAERKLSMAQSDKDKQRRRRSSSLMYQEPPESLEQMSDQAVLPNLNAQWVNAKGKRHGLYSSGARRKANHGITML